MNAARRAIQGLFGLACIAAAAGCSNDGYVVVVRFETPALAMSVEHVEVSLVASCAMQGRAGEPAVGARQSIDFARGTSGAALGDAPPGTYGLYARGSSSSCAVVATGCADVTLAAGGKGELVVTLSAVAGPGCPAGTTCTSGACRGPDAGFDAGAVSDAGSDARVPPPLDAGGLDANLPDAAVGGDAGCTPGPDACLRGQLVHCLAGALVATPCMLGCSPTDPTRCARVLPSNVLSVLLTRGTADFVVPASWSPDTSACSIPGVPSTTESQSDGTAVCVVAVHSLSVPAGVTLRVTGSLPLVVLASGNIDIAGTVDLSAHGETPGAGGGQGGDATTTAGTGDAPGRGGAHAGTYADGGGGGGGMCGSGGAGGGGGAALGGAGGAAAAVSTELSPLHGGSGGGTGSTSPTEGLGGAGGGALQLTAAGSITITGRILAGGGGGAGGRVAGMCTGNAGAGGGGGSGGAILIEATTIFAAGATLVAAGGGGGGGASACIAGEGSGGAGQDGAFALDVATGGATGGATFGAPGAQSGGGAMLSGAAGSSNAGAASNGGGGGGGSGCILLRDASGSLPAGTSVLSPSIAPGVRAATVQVE